MILAASLAHAGLIGSVTEATPEPNSFLLLGTALAVLGFLVRRRRPA